MNRILCAIFLMAGLFRLDAASLPPPYVRNFLNTNNALPGPSNATIKPLFIPRTGTNQTLSIEAGTGVTLTITPTTIVVTASSAVLPSGASETNILIYADPASASSRSVRIFGGQSTSTNDVEFLLYNGTAYAVVNQYGVRVGTNNAASGMPKVWVRNTSGVGLQIDNITGAGSSFVIGNTNGNAITFGADGSLTLPGGTLILTPGIGQGTYPFQVADTNGNIKFWVQGTNSQIWASGTNGFGLSASNTPVPGRSADLIVSNTPVFRLFNDGTAQALGTLKDLNGNAFATSSGNGFAALELQTNDVRVGLQTNVNFLTTANLSRYATNNTASNKVDLLLDTAQGIQTSSTPQFARMGIGQAADAGIGLVGLAGFIFSNSATPNFVYWTNGQMTIASTNQPGYSNYLAGYVLTLSNSFAAPTNTHQDIGLRMFGSTYLTGAGFGVATPSAELLWSPTIGAPPAAGTWVFQTRTNINGIPTTNLVLSTVTLNYNNGAAIFSSSGSLTLGGSLTVGNATAINVQNKGSLFSPSTEDWLLWNNGNNGFGKLQFGGTTAAFPGLGRTNGDLVVFGGDGTFGGGATNRLLIHGGLVVGKPGTAGTLTNTLYASATLDFPSTAAGGVSDLPITVSGAADGDIVSLGVPSAQLTGLTGDYFGWSSNGVVYVRFANNNLVSAQDPASGTFKVRVDKFQ